MLWRVFCLLLVLSARSLREVLLKECDVDKALEVEPTDDEDIKYRFCLLKRFKKNTKEAVLTMVSGSSKSTPVLLLLSRIAMDASLLSIPVQNLISFFVQVSSEISTQYLANRHDFSEPIKLYSNSYNEIDEILTTIWSRDSLVVDKFFTYIYNNKIGLSTVHKQLEFLASYKEKRAFGMLGDIYYYGLSTPVDVDKALEYYMAGKALKDSHSLVGIGKILMSEPFNDVEQATRLFDEAISLEKDPEAYYRKHLFYSKEHPSEESKVNNFFNNDQITPMLKSSAMAGYLPAVHEIACINAKIGIGVQAFPSFMSITQYAPFLLDTFSKAYQAYTNKEYKKSFLLYLYLSEYKLEVATKNSVYILENYDIFPDQQSILFDLYSELAITNKKYYKYMGDCYYNGTGVEKSLSLAFGYYLSSIGYSDESLYNVAYMFENGEGVPRNLSLAYKYISGPFKRKTSYLVVLYGKLRIAIKMVLTGHGILWSPYVATIIASVLAVGFAFYFFGEKTGK